MFDNACFHCGKEVPSTIHFEPNTGSIGYCAKILFDSGCFCSICNRWFCGECSGEDELGLGSHNFHDGYLHLLCPDCHRQARTKIAVADRS